MKSIFNTTLLAFLPLSTLMLCSCASVSVFKETEQSQKQFIAPKKILVRDFTGEPQVFRVDRKGDSLTEFQKNTAMQLSRDLVAKLNASVMPAEALSSDAKTPKGKLWLITGSFDRVNQGSRLLRTLIGLGAGGTKIETTVHVSSLLTGTPREVFSFRTTGGSNTEPGPGILMGPPDPTTLFPLIWGSTMPGLSKDTTRTAKEIAAEIADYLERHGVTPEDPKLQVKRLKNPKN